jgi:hypothetical protein
MDEDDAGGSFCVRSQYIIRTEKGDACARRLF